MARQFRTARLKWFKKENGEWDIGDNDYTYFGKSFQDDLPIKYSEPTVRDWSKCEAVAFIENGDVESYIDNDEIKELEVWKQKYLLPNNEEVEYTFFRVPDYDEFSTDDEGEGDLEVYTQDGKYTFNHFEYVDAAEIVVNEDDEDNYDEDTVECANIMREMLEEERDPWDG